MPWPQSVEAQAGAAEYALESCEKYPDRFGIMARVPQNKPEEGKAMMRAVEHLSAEDLMGIAPPK